MQNAAFSFSSVLKPESAVDTNIAVTQASPADTITAKQAAKKPALSHPVAATKPAPNNHILRQTDFYQPPRVESGHFAPVAPAPSARGDGTGKESLTTPQVLSNR